MTETQKNWDPGVKKFFLKILNSFSWGLLWMLTAATAGIYFELAYTNGKPLIYTILYYVVMGVSLFLLVRYLARVWKSNDEER